MTIVQATDHFALLGILLAIVAACIFGERKNWLGNISGVLVAIFLAAILASVGVIPTGSSDETHVPVYDFAFTYLIPFSIPLLLFNVKFSKIIRESGRLIVIFLLGALGVVIGAILAAWILDIGENTYKVAAVFTATYTGGSVNFMTVATTLNFLEDPLFAATIVTDNTITIIYIMLLFLLPKLKFLQSHFPKADFSDEEIVIEPEVETISLMEQIAAALAFAGSIAALGMWIGAWLERLLQTDLSLGVLMITILILLVANVFHKTLQRLEKVAFQIGMYMLYVFLAVIGASCDISTLFTSSPKVLVFALIVLIVHLGVSLVAGKYLKFSLEEIAIASCANTGGAATSAPMAATFQIKKAITPAILIGIMGYVIGTFLGIGVGLLLK